MIIQSELRNVMFILTQSELRQSQKANIGNNNNLSLLNYINLSGIEYRIDIS